MLEMLFRGFGKKKQPKVDSVRLSHKQDEKEDDKLARIQRDFEKANEERVKQGLPPFVNYAEWAYGDKDHFNRNKPKSLTEEDKIEECRKMGYIYEPHKGIVGTIER